MIPLLLALWSGPARAGEERGQVERPPVLEAQGGCELWRGVAHGNDPSAQLEFELCPAEGGRLRGRMQWSSLESGSCVRKIDGISTGAGVHLVDLAIIEDHPQPGWHFCKADSYDFHLEGADRMVGTYDSEACNDHATVTLDRVHGNRVVDEGNAVAKRLERARAEEEERGGWLACASTGGAGGGGVLFAVGLALVRRRRRGARLMAA